MAKNNIQVESDQVTIIMDSSNAVSSGDVVSVFEGSEGFTGISKNDVPAGEEGVLLLTGIWRLAKTSTLSWDVGDALYWNATENEVTNVATNNRRLGNAVNSRASGTTNCDVYLNRNVV